MECLFCKIAAGEIPGDKVYENEKVLALLDIHPRSPGHTFVIPKEHYANLEELPEELVKPLFEAVKKVGGMLKEKLDADGITFGINQGRASGQEIDHLHVHIMPRWQDDGGGSVQSIVASGERMSREEVREKLNLELK